MYVVVCENSVVINCSGFFWFGCCLSRYVVGGVENEDSVDCWMKCKGDGCLFDLVYK